MRAWRKWLGSRVGTITEKAAREPPFIFDMLREVRDGQPPLVQLEDFGTVVAARDGIVEHDGVRHVVSTDGDAIERLILTIGPLFISVLFVLEVAHREEFEPRSCVKFAIANQFKWRGDATTKPTRHLIDRGDGVENGVEPVLAADLFLGEICTSYPDDGEPSLLNETI